MAGIRRNFKDTLFCRLFGSEDCKDNALSLYNALAGTEYADPDELEINTLGDFVYFGVKNDVSYLIGGVMMLVEHQSTHNPNMPLRGLQYFSRLFAKLVEARGLNLYREAPVALPTPRFAVLYFGEAARPEREVMRLSDLYAEGPGDLEVTATVYNCNPGFNEGIMRECEALCDYVRLIELVREARELGFGIDESVRAAVVRCIDEGRFDGFLAVHRAEVEDMLFTMEDEERAMKIYWDDVRKEATEQGLQEGREEGLREGREEGRDEERARIEAALREAGVDSAIIQSVVHPR